MRVRLLHRPAPLNGYLMAALGQPIAVTPTTCQCQAPDLQPLGSWWPSDFQACATCGRPVLDP